MRTSPLRNGGLALSLAITATVAGCSSLLDIHALPDAADDDDGRANPDGPDPDAPDLDAATDAPDLDATDARLDAAMIDAAMIDAPAIDATVDAMAIDAGLVTIGEYAALSSMTTVNGNFIIARRISVGADTVVVAAGAFLKFEPANGRIKFAIYNDNANSPFTRRVFSGDITLDGVAGYEQINIGPHTLTGGFSYWIVMATDMSVDIGSLDSNNVNGAAASLPYSGAFPTTYSPQPASSATADRVNLYLQAQP